MVVLVNLECSKFVVVYMEDGIGKHRMKHSKESLSVKTVTPMQTWKAEMLKQI